MAAANNAATRRGPPHVERPAQDVDLDLDLDPNLDLDGNVEVDPIVDLDPDPRVSTSS